MLLKQCSFSSSKLLFPASSWKSATKATFRFVFWQTCNALKQHSVLLDHKLKLCITAIHCFITHLAAFHWEETVWWLSKQEWVDVSHEWRLPCAYDMAKVAVGFRTKNTMCSRKQPVINVSERLSSQYILQALLLHVLWI